MHRVTVVARLKAKAGLEEQVKQELLKMVEATRKEKGCLNYDLHVDNSDPQTFLFYENWVSRMALEDHFQTEHFLNLRSKQNELFAEPSAINIMKMISDPE
ncbi:MAG: antibiotic biosynthesis monooxygenase [Candidatus Obscuribacterales bacterium]|nr:antibiotic biosynthesis monooxygenase [Candidatus Obscuribacterales bacterium]